MKKVLVSGGAGFIGTNLIAKLIELKIEVVSIDNYSTGSKKNELQLAKYVDGDIESIQQFDNQNFDYCIHLAAQSRVQPSFEDPEESFRVNAKGTLKVMQWARKNNIKVIYAGSSSKHHDPSDSPYAMTKYLGEEICKLYKKSYDVDVEIGQVRPGPVVTLYGLKPGWITKIKKEKQFDSDGNVMTDENGRQIMKEVESKNRVRVDSIISREKDLSLALKTPSIRIETPVLGESLVGIEVPNPNPGLIGIKSLIKDSSFKNLLLQKDSLPIALGKGSGGDNITIDLTKMPHLLIAGATGSGKSVCINAVVSSLIYSRSPDQLRLLLVDPKRVELTQYNGIPHMVTPVIVELDAVAKVFRGIINEMFKRYKLLESHSVRNISELNKKFSNALPYLVIVIDELADLMMTSGIEIERSICRLAQLGRATGIHLVIATQRPSVDVVTGLIKSNFPSRVSFSVSSSIDSRTILDTTGAEKLLGKGDMLYLPIDATLPFRLQGCFINDSEISKLVNFWRNNSFMNSQYEINVFDDLNQINESTSSDDSDSNKDSLYNDAVGLAKSTKKLSISFLQRKLRIGYPRAARLMDELEEEGIVGPMQNSIKARDVIIN